MLDRAYADGREQAVAKFRTAWQSKSVRRAIKLEWDRADQRGPPTEFVIARTSSVYWGRGVSENGANKLGYLTNR